MRKADQVDLHVAEQLRRRRRLLNLAQREVAVVCGVRFQQIQKYEAGATRISAGRLWVRSPGRTGVRRPARSPARRIF